MRRLAPLVLMVLFSLLAARAVRAAASTEPATTVSGTSDERTAVIQLDHPRHVPTALDSVDHPWPGVALPLSAIGVAAPILIMDRWSRTHSGGLPVMVMLAAEVVTPSAGHLYAGLTHRALIGVAARGLAFGLAAAGGASAGLWSNTTTADWTPALFVVLVGASVEAVVALADVVTVASDVQRRNQDWLAARAVLGVRMLPSGSAPALVLSVKF